MMTTLLLLYHQRKWCTWTGLVEAESPDHNTNTISPPYAYRLFYLVKIVLVKIVLFSICCITVLPFVL